MNIPEEGFYYLNNDNEEPALVYGYRCTDMNGQFVFGFNTYEGGGLIPLFDLTEDTKITKATVCNTGEVFKR